MDVVAHTLWAGVGMALWRRYRPITRSTVAATAGLAALPDILHLLPIAAWALFGDGTWAVVRAYAIAVPSPQPWLPPIVDLLSHHLHCVMHSAMVAGAVTLVAGWTLRALWVPLLGWWSHIVIDVFTHSVDYYPTPVLYPVTERGFDGLAWVTPWFLVLNYLALGTVGAWLFFHRRDFDAH